MLSVRARTCHVQSVPSHGEVHEMASVISYARVRINFSMVVEAANQKIFIERLVVGDLYFGIRIEEGLH